MMIDDNETQIRYEISPNTILLEQKKDISLKHVRFWVKDGKLPPNNYYKMNRVLNKMADEFKSLKISEEEDLQLMKELRQ